MNKSGIRLQCYGGELPPAEIGILIVGINYTERGSNLWNFPDEEPSTLTPNDLTVISATPTSLSMAATGDGFSLNVQVGGQFSNIQNIIGMPFGDASQLITGSYDEEIQTITQGDSVSVKSYIYSPPRPIEPITTFDATFAEVAELWSGDDVFIGDRDTPSSDGVYGFDGNDRFVMTYGQDYLETFRGGDGMDTAVFESSSQHWEIKPTDSAWNELTQQSDLKGYTVTDTRFVDTSDYGDRGHILQIVEVERLEFTDKKVALDFARDENAYKAAALITAMFGSDLVQTYFAPAVELVDQGLTDVQIAQLVIDLGLVDTSSNANFVSTIYENVVGLAPDPLTQAIYANQLTTGEISHAGLVVVGSSSSVVESQMSELAIWRETGLDYLGF